MNAERTFGEALKREAFLFCSAKAPVFSKQIYDILQRDKLPGGGRPAERKDLELAEKRRGPDFSFLAALGKGAERAGAFAGF